MWYLLRLLLLWLPSLLVLLHSVWVEQGAMAVAALTPSAARIAGTTPLGITRITSMVSCGLPKMQWEWGTMCVIPRLCGLQ